MKINLISLVFFLSGCSALIFETVWFRIASTVLGSSIWSAAAVLTAFMAGLGLGNILTAWYGHRITKPISFYIMLEIMIGISGVISVLLLPLLNPIIARLLAEMIQETSILNLIRFSLAFIVFLIPAATMGATLPVLQKVLYAHDRSFARSFARLYGWNTIGAVVGTLMAGFWLITLLGLKGSAYSASLLNLFAALILLRSFDNKSIHSNEEPEIRPLNLYKYKRFLIPPFLSGLILLALEVIWFRYMVLVQAGTSTTFALMLAIVLVGIGVGGFLATKLSSRNFNIDKTLKYLLFFAAISVVIGFYLNNLLLQHFYFETQTNPTYFIVMSMILMLPTCVITGMLFPLFATKLFQQVPETTLASGIATFMNTIGAAIGSGMATFFLLPLVGIEISLFLLAMAYFIILIIISIIYEQNTNIFSKVGPTLLGFLLVSLIFPFGTLDSFYSMLSKKRYPNEELVLIKEGLNETLRYHKTKLYDKVLSHRLLTNNHSMSATGFSAKRYMKLYAYFPYIFHNNIKNVLQISYGVGNTAEAITRLNNVERFDIVDVSKDILNLSSIIHNDTQWFPLKDKRVNIHIEDGRFFLQTTKQTYDLITGEPPPPKMSGIVNLYSKEYFSLMKTRLNPGGIATYWLPVHSLHEGDTLSIIKAFCDVFSDCSLWNGYRYDFMLVGSNGGLNPVSEQRMNTIWNSYLATELKMIGLEKPSQLGALYMADNLTLTKFTKYTMPVTDDHPHRISPITRKYNTEPDINHRLMSFKRRKTEFKNSTYVKNLFPKTLMNEMISDFNIESTLTKVAFSHVKTNELKYWQDLLYFLTNTKLEVAPLLYLRSNPDEQVIVSGIKNHTDPLYLVKQAEGLLATRDYQSASETLKTYFARADNKFIRLYDLKLYFFINALNKSLNISEFERIKSNLPSREVLTEWDQYANWLIQTFPESTQIKN